MTLSPLQQTFRFGPQRRNLVIEAGAGTGKTTAIVGEVLRILLDDEEQAPERIVLVTFTEKAAGEIADRIHGALADLEARFDDETVAWPAKSPRPLVVVPPERKEAWRRACRRQLARIDSLRSQTIHSFCQSLLRQFPIEAGIDPQFKIIEGFERTLLHGQVYDAWVDEETRIHPTPQVEEEWEFLIAHFGYLFQIRDAVFQLVDRRDLLSSGYGIGDAGTLTAPLPAAIAAVAEGDMGAMSRYFRRGGVAPSTLDEWIDYFAPVASEIRSAKLPRGKGAAHVSDALKVLRAGDIGSSIYDRLVGHRAAMTLVNLTRRFLAYLDGEKRKLGVLDFDDLLLRTLAVLDEDEVLERARSQYDFIFVDEFQDTDRTQGHIIERLARDRSGSLVPGKTIIVGDPKQSIYGFRRADPETYFQFGQRLVDERAEHRILEEQYRSDRPLLDAVNAMFARLFPAVLHDPNVFRPSYHELRPGKAADARPLDARITMLQACEGDKGEPLAVAEWIAAHRGDTAADLRRFAILFRRTTKLDDYLDALDRYGIDFVLPPTRFFLDRRAPVDLLAVLRAIGFPFDRGAEISAARTPYFALTDEEIVAAGAAWDQFQSTLAAYREAAQHLPVADLIDLVLAGSKIEAVYDASADGERSKRHLEHVRAIAFEYDQKIGGSVRQFVDEIARRRAEPDEMEPSLADETRNAVRILTVHAAKGLEFDTVILPDLSFPIRQPDIYAIEQPPRLVMINPATVSADETAKAIGKAREEAETQRLFYVAVTRAQSEVVFVCNPEGKRMGFAKILSEVLPADETSWPENTSREVRQTDIGPVAFERLAVSHEGMRARRKLRDAALEAELRAGPIVPPAIEPPPPAVETLSSEIVAVTRARARNRAAGILLHRVLERWDGSGDVEPLLQLLGAEAGTDEPTLDRVRQRLSTVAHSEMFRRIAAAETLGRELPVRLLEKEAVVEKRIDRLIRENGREVVVDYKSGAPEESRLAGDRGQVRRYCEAIEAITGRPCAGMLWYVDMDGEAVVEVLNAEGRRQNAEC